MANGFIFGRRTPGGGGTISGYECAVQHIPSQILSYIGDISGDDAYSSIIRLEYPLIFPSRIIQDAQDLLAHLGLNGMGNIMFSGEGLTSNTLLGKPTTGAAYGFRYIQYGKGASMSSFDLYIWAKFED